MKLSDIPEEIKKLDLIYNDRFTGPVYYHRLVKLLADVDFAGKKVLDAGCGYGLPSYVVRRGYGAAYVAGLNINPGQLEEARKVFDRYQGDVVFINADMRAMPFADNSFDVVLATDVLEHIKDLGAALDEVSRVLKPGGVIAVSLPSENLLYDIGRNIFGGGRKPADHFWTAAQAEKVILSKFRPLKVSYAPFFFMPLYRLILAEN